MQRKDFYYILDRGLNRSAVICKIFITTLTVLLSISWGDIEVEKVLETKNISEYNSWVKANKASYPLLPMYKVRAEGLRVYYYNDDGRVPKEKTFQARDGWGMHLHSSSYTGIIMAVEYDLSQGETASSIHTVIENGDRLWSFTWGFDYPTNAGVRFLPNGLGIFRSRPYDKDPGNCYAELLSWDGNYITRVESLCTINIGSKATPDGRFMLLNGGYKLLLIKDNHELWRKSFTSSFKATVSNDGKYVCVGDSCAIYVYDQHGAQLYSYEFSLRGSQNPYSCFSNDNQYLAAATSNELVLFNNITGELIWRKSVDGDNFKRHLFFLNNFVILTHTSKAEIFVYDLEGCLQKTLNVSSLYCSVVDDLIIINAEKEKFHKIIYRIE